VKDIDTVSGLLIIMKYCEYNSILQFYSFIDSFVSLIQSYLLFASHITTLQLAH